MGLEKNNDTINNNNNNKNTKSLYDRMGGDKLIMEITQSFWDEMLENKDLSLFFKNAAMSALKYHCLKFFRVILGPQNEVPPLDDIMDYLLQTHSRLFREMDMNMKHFDIVVECLEQSLDAFAIPNDQKRDVIEIWTATRPIFEYGCKVAAQEKTMTTEELTTLPQASSKTMKNTDDNNIMMKVRLPNYSQTCVPVYLKEALKKATNQTNVRAWTCDLTERFCPDGDIKIAGTFMYQPFMAHHAYCVAFLELAFLPDDNDNDDDDGYDTTKHQIQILEIVLYPRGRNHSPLSRTLFDHMIIQFQETCDTMGLPHYAKYGAVEKLKSFRQAFRLKSDKNDGMDAPHVLSRAKMGKRNIKQKKKSSNNQKSFSSSKISRNKSPKKDRSPTRTVDVDHNDDSFDTGDDSCSCSASSLTGGTLSGGSTVSTKSTKSSSGWMSFFLGQKKVMHVVQ